MDESATTGYTARMLDETDDIHPLFHGAPKTTEFRKRIVAAVREAVDQYGMVDRTRPAEASKDRWLVCLSGGKDSYH